MALIYHQSSDPVFVKKIYLKLWRLRDEVEAVINHKTALGEEVDKEAIAKEYEYKGPLQKPQLELIEGGGEKAAGTPENTEAAAPDLAAVEDATEAAPEQSDQVEIIQRSSDIIPEEKQFKGISVLAELGMDHMYFFCNHRFVEGQSIVIEFQIPNRFVLNAEIVYCRAFNLRSRIISDDKLPFRVAVKFTFLKAGERTLLREFVQSIEPKVKTAPKKEAKANTEGGASAAGGGGDGFDELDGLDL